MKRLTNQKRHDLFIGVDGDSEDIHLGPANDNRTDEDDDAPAAVEVTEERFEQIPDSTLRDLTDEDVNRGVHADLRVDDLGDGRKQ